MTNISVVIPCYNRAGVIGEALASVRAQTRKPFEILVVDDASTDGSVDIAQRAGARVVRLDRNAGSAAARNAGTRDAQGDTIAWLDSDDFWEPEHLATVAALLESHPEACAASAAVRFVGARSGTWDGRIPPGDAVDVFREAFYDWLTPTISTVVRKSALLEIGGFDETERFATDFDVWVRLARLYPFVATRKVTANWRWHSQQLSANPERQWLATYKFRFSALRRVVADGDYDLAEQLNALLAQRWLADLRSAWDQERLGWLRQLLDLRGSIPAVPPRLAWKWEIRSRIPSGIRHLIARGRGAASK